MKTVKITCDCCKKTIAGKRFKLFAYDTEDKNENGKNIKSFEEDSLKTDFCESCVKKILKVNNNSTNSESQIGTRQKLDIEKVMSMKESGMKASEIADELGTTAGTISQMIYKYKKENE